MTHPEPTRDTLREEVVGWPLWVQFPPQCSLPSFCRVCLTNLQTPAALQWLLASTWFKAKATRLTFAKWNFTVGKKGGVLRYLLNLCRTLNSHPLQGWRGQASSGYQFFLAAVKFKLKDFEKNVKDLWGVLNWLVMLKMPSCGYCSLPGLGKGNCPHWCLDSISIKTQRKGTPKNRDQYILITSGTHLGNGSTVLLGHPQCQQKQALNSYWLWAPQINRKRE
jgi:hypothetical protein